MLPNEPGHSATVLVAFAEIGGTPSHTMAGNVMSVPPPAIELTAPPTSAARNTSKYAPADTPPECIEASRPAQPPWGQISIFDSPARSGGLGVRSLFSSSSSRLGHFLA